LIFLGENSFGVHEEKKSLVIWERVCKRKEFGGMGVINLCDFNKALLLKWW